jgi:hypothetical protein
MYHSPRSLEAEAMKLGILLLFFSMYAIAAQETRPGGAQTCAQVSLARRGFGASYQGTVRNDDYKFRVTIPEGLKGWGADPVAPFHGFTVFLPSEGDLNSCIVLEIHLRVELGEREARHRGTKVAFGGVTGWKQEATGTVSGTEISNITIRFSVVHARRVDDGTIWLISPTKDMAKNLRLLDTFLSEIAFNP